MPLVNLNGSYGYIGQDRRRRYYGPGLVDVPDGLLRSLGLKPASELPQPGPKAEPVQILHTPLPAEFPGRAYLVKAGYETTNAVCKLTFDDLTAVKGIGPKMAGQILAAIGEVE